MQGEPDLLRNEFSVSVPNADTVVLGGNLRRVGLVISAPPTSPITIRFGGPAVSGQGIVLTNGQAPLYLSEGHLGHALREEVHAISPGGAQQVSGVEVFTT